MPEDEYWNGDPRRVQFYRELNKVKNDLKNQELWLQGLYTRAAILDVAEKILTKKGKPLQNEYPELPLDITGERAAEIERKKQENIEKEREKAIAFFTGIEKDFKK